MVKTYVLPNNETTTNVETYLTTWRDFFNIIEVIFNPLKLKICCASYGKGHINMGYFDSMDDLHQHQHTFVLPFPIALLIVNLYNKALNDKE